MITTLLAAAVIIGVCFVFLGVGVLFFGKTAQREPCGQVPGAVHEDCPSQKAGLCPVEDLSGTMRLANRAKISYPKHT